MAEIYHLSDYGGPGAQLPYSAVAEAKRLMRRGLDLYQAASALNVRPRDLDLFLWMSMGGGWA